jgi:hypothetical protein
MPDDETQHQEPPRNSDLHDHDLDAFTRERSVDPLNLNFLSSIDRLARGLTDLGGSVWRRLRERVTKRRRPSGE